jgi:toxin FitB
VTLTAGWLLDTNVLSELSRPDPNPAVATFLDRIGPAYVSAVSLHELCFGIERLPDGRRKEGLRQWLAELEVRYADAVIPVGPREAVAAAHLRAAAAGGGRTIHLPDGLIAGSAFCHGLILATRNVTDFGATAVRIVNPWDEGPPH